MNGYLKQTVENLLSAIDLYPKFLNLDKDSLFNHLLQSDDKDLYVLTSSTFTDDFIDFKFRVDEKIYLVWKLNDRKVFESLKDYDQRVHLTSVDVNEIMDV